ncbi:hypothetical protein HH214_13280 [Mucilaginibacter robiniae]|uniref:Uncharacterized protein n=1 Tax=Mucilaginibacter robiniae TaxID=2728022 RepID=A0A7L5DTE3_9SPHI|nr:hypothetical protein [Mucilaginibacter robiniae]QJD94360.1 hypothetical protein HH214_13275 [Mucilaginibacter robiniae]QJD94361.1 hypothetical protein HH214_13280 [Mucilaginibacter robiniae]
MKKIFVIAALFLATGVVSSCTKENSVKPSTQSNDVILSTGDARPSSGGHGNG